MQTAEKVAESREPGQLPYLVTVIKDESATLVAVVATSGIAFSVYYAAIRDYVGTAKVRLSQGDRTLASSVN